MDSKTVQRSAFWRSRRELSNAYLLANFGFDTAENEPCKFCPLSVYRSPRYTAEEYKTWLLTRAGEWAVTAERVDVWKATCETRFGRVPEAKDMSIQELEETLIVVGDEDVEGIKAGTESMFDGTVLRFIA